MSQTKAYYLWPQVGILSARNFVAVDFSKGRLQVGLEHVVALANIFPVLTEALQLGDFKARVTLCSSQCSLDGVDGRLTGKTRHAGNSTVHNVYTFFCSQKVCCHLVSTGVVGVEVNWAVQGILQGTHQHLGGIGLEKTRHILDGDGVGTTVTQLLCHLYVIVQGVLVSFRIADVSCVTDGCFHQLVALGSLIHGNFHTRNPVQGVENTEHIDSTSSSLTNKASDYIVRIVGIAYTVCTTEQHLEGNVGNIAAQPVQSLPGIFMEEAIGYVKGGSTPHFQGEALVHDLCQSFAALYHVTGTNTSCQQ